MRRALLFAITSAAVLGCGLDLAGSAFSDSGVAGDGSIALDATSGGDANGGADGGVQDSTTGGDSQAKDGGTSTDANGIDAPADAGTIDATADASDGGTISGRFTCGSTTCDLATEICCKALGAYTCLLRGVVCTGATITCSERADCPSSQVCCARLDGQGRLTGVSCSQSCNGNATELCNPDAGTCPPGKTCQPTSSELQGDYECI